MNDNTTPPGHGYAGPVLLMPIAHFAERLDANLRDAERLDAEHPEVNPHDPVDALMTATKYATKVYATPESLGYGPSGRPMTDEERAAYRAERDAERAWHEDLARRLREAAAGDPGAAAVLELHSPKFDDYSGTPDCGGCETGDYGPESWPCPTAETMAAAYEISTEDDQ